MSHPIPADLAGVDAATEAAYRLALTNLRSFSLSNVRFSLGGTHMVAAVLCDGRPVATLFSRDRGLDCTASPAVVKEWVAEARIFTDPFLPGLSTHEVFGFYVEVLVFAALLDANLLHVLTHDRCAWSRREVCEVPGNDTLYVKAARLLVSGSQVADANPHWWDRRESRFVPADVLADGVVLD